MENLWKLLWKVLWEKNLAKISKWALIQQIINNFLKENLKKNFQITWKIEFDLFIIKSPNSQIGHYLFLNKKKLLDKINQKLEKMNLWKIKEIKII